jgi:hypothetical protein
MKYVVHFLKFWYHFIVGDDWTLAVGIVIGFCIIWLLAHNGHAQVWWLLPLLVICLLVFSLQVGIRRIKAK